MPAIHTYQVVAELCAFSPNLTGPFEWETFKERIGRVSPFSTPPPEGVTVQDQENFRKMFLKLKEMINGSQEMRQRFMLGKGGTPVPSIDAWRTFVKNIWTTNKIQRAIVAEIEKCGFSLPEILKKDPQAGSDGNAVFHLILICSGDVVMKIFGEEPVIKGPRYTTILTNYSGPFRSLFQTIVEVMRRTHARRLEIKRKQALAMEDTIRVIEGPESEERRILMDVPKLLKLLKDIRSYREYADGSSDEAMKQKGDELATFTTRILEGYNPKKNLQENLTSNDLSDLSRIVLLEITTEREVRTIFEERRKILEKVDLKDLENGDSDSDSDEEEEEISRILEVNKCREPGKTEAKDDGLPVKLEPVVKTEEKNDAITVKIESVVKTEEKVDRLLVKQEPAVHDRKRKETSPYKIHLTNGSSKKVKIES